jgi:hypothetical protein
MSSLVASAFGWCVADAESAASFKPLFEETFSKHAVPPGQLNFHADRGGPMRAKSTAFPLADLGVTRSHVSNDNPYSESRFKTLKYQPRFPRNFGRIEDARGFRAGYFGSTGTTSVRQQPDRGSYPGTSVASAGQGLHGTVMSRDATRAQVCIHLHTGVVRTWSIALKSRGFRVGTIIAVFLPRRAITLDVRSRGRHQCRSQRM